MAENVITPKTLVRGKVDFKEPTGSTQNYEFVLTVEELGFNPADVALQPPSQDEVTQALESGNRDLLAKLGEQFTRAKAAATADPTAQLRKLLVKHFENGGVPNHPINSDKYTWVGGENALTVVAREDDDLGTITGTPKAMYINVTGSAVWGLN